ncbi:uncharacterized protein LOC121861768 [Homarus americanus]|uniref:uncharacterized protein LOC121861768 n=1 Tax=Homarus americanus TaxID=6706 RepID=UPI001C4628BE|nr:uncharacterized protein LOC121861768 [Homarus americanus]
MTLDGRGRGFETQRSATSEVVGQEVELRGSRSTSECVEMRGTRATNEGVALRSNRSTTLDGRGSSRKGIIVMRDDTEPDGGTQVHRYKSTAKWETKTVGTVKIDPSSHTEKDNIEEMNGVAVKNLQTVDLETNGEGNSTPPTPPEKIEEDEVVFMSPKKFGMKGKTEKNKGNEEEEEQGGVREEERVGGMDEEEKVESCPPETPAQKDKVYDSPNKHHHHHHQVADPGDEPTSCGVEEGVLGQKSGSPSPLVGGTLGRTSGRDSVASSHASSTDTSCLTHPDEEIERLLQFNEKKITSLTPLGPTYTKDPGPKATLPPNPP